MYLLDIKNRNTGKRCEICSKLTMRIPEQLQELRHRRRSGIFVVSFEHFSQLYIFFLLLALSR